MRKRLKNIWFKLGSKRMLRKIENDRSFVYKELEISLEPGIFHPKYFASSQMLLEWVESHEISNKQIIEVGCGSGITSLRAAQKGAHVWAIDINSKAIALLQKNAKMNQISLHVQESNLFAEIPKTTFDFILINPPFYPKDPQSAAESAWFCGAGFEYFQNLFSQLNDRSISSGIFMTLSDDCDLKRIQFIAKEHGYVFQLKKTKKSIFEKNFLFEITA